VPRSKASYIVEVHYPETREEMLELRRRMGNEYIDFVKKYIKTLPISNEKKNKLYLDINNKRMESYESCTILTEK